MAVVFPGGRAATEGALGIGIARAAASSVSVVRPFSQRAHPLTETGIFLALAVGLAGFCF